ncbi:CsgE family curli-type amyloid fiber assembly protein [Daejeonia sp. YH14]|uniref:CsgE family curli-type amyloid fiber assembly protein n=1 Tax=Daejeonia sp. YH14 TaxID=3439042 RepID=UPI003F498A46
MKSLGSFLVLLNFILPALFFAQEDSVVVIPNIEKTEMEDMVSLKALATNSSKSYQELDYLFIAIKRGNSGNLSNSRQSGKFTLAPSETKKISEINIRLDKSDALKSFLYLRNEQSDKLIAKDSLEINPKELKKNFPNNTEDNLYELKGLTIDETKTKIGKDFYDLFFIDYSNLKDKADSPVTIAELPTRGTTTQISILMDDRTLYSFVSNPSEDYLRENAKLAIRIINDYIKKNELIKNEFKY